MTRKSLSKSLQNQIVPGIRVSRDSPSIHRLVQQQQQNKRFSAVVAVAVHRSERNAGHKKGSRVSLVSDLYSCIRAIFHLLRH